LLVMGLRSETTVPGTVRLAKDKDGQLRMSL
jgi:hypothetical protein